MEPGTPDRNREKLPDEARRAIGFVNKVFTSFDFDWREKAKRMPAETFNQWRHDVTAACEAFWLGVKPAVLVENLKDPDAVQQYLDEAGRNAFVYRNTMIVDRDLVMQRIANELDFARELGWHDDMTVDDWLAQASPGGDGRQRSIIGFFLGYPRSAVNAYGNKQISEPRGVNIEGPNGGRAFYFTTDVHLAEADDVKALAEKTRAAFNNAGLGQFFRDKNGT